MEIKEIVFEKGYQLVLTKKEWDNLWFYFNHRYHNHDITEDEYIYSRGFFDKLEDYRLANLK